MAPPEGGLTVRERPILFSAPMIRAIQADLKTQTRRVCRLVNPRSMEAPARCPYGVPGDRLWLRETWYCDHVFARTRGTDAEIAAWRKMLYFGADYLTPQDWSNADEWSERTPAWRPSIHMPRWASRCTLQITSVRAQRLQNISEDDALAEGVDPYEWPGGPANPSARDAYAELWDRINGKRASWSSNPWVWAIGFKRVDATQAGAAHG